jgi:LuxR family maltose regulon positive regulatory protein
MDTLFLATKLYIPPLRPNLVPRPRLIERLDEGLRLGHRLTLISASAGFGKTTLATEWLHSAGRPLAWLSLDEGDNDPARFLTYLIAALQTLDPGLGQAAQSLLGAPQLPSLESLATLLVNDMGEIDTPFTLVLDDYHLVTAPYVHDTLTFLLEHGPPQVHLVIATRRDPPLPLPRLRVRGQMTEIRANDLRFTVEEAAAFLDQALGLTLDAELVAALEARTEGWIAGLQLAALSMQGKTTEHVTDFVAAFSGSHRHVIDYLAEEVLAQQPPEMRDFARQTSILDRLSAPLCDAVTGRDDSAAVLRQLEQANLFLVPLDEERAWYRYHRLFADFLRTDLEPEWATALHLKAARWFAAHDLLPEAARHALAYATGRGDTNEVTPIIVRAAHQAFYKGEIVTLLGWLDTLPDDVVRANSDLAAYKATGLYMSGHAEAGESYLESAEISLPADASPVHRGMLLGLRSYGRDAPGVLQLAQEALELIGEADPASRSSVLFMLGDAQDATGDVAGAIRSFQEALQLGQQYGNQVIAAIALGHLGISLNEQGQRRQAVALCRRGVEQYVDARGRPLPIAGLIHVTLGALEYEANDLIQARRYLQQGLELGRQSAMTRLILYALEELARLEHALGEREAALTTIQEAGQLASRTGERELWANAIAADEADLQLKQGNVLAAARWAGRAGLAAPLDPARKREYPVYVRLLLAQNRPGGACTLLADLERLAQEDGHCRQLITHYIQHALAQQMLGAQEGALACLEQALRLAAPEDYVRAFLDEGPLVADLLPNVRHVAPAFVDALLQGLAGETKAAESPLIEPLSERELEVLRLLAQDLTSPQIARELVIAVSTVRSHLKSIYRKLDAHSRYEAVERAKALRLL